MERYIYDENNGLWYELHGDYYLPCLALPDDKEEPYIGIWGQRHMRYLKEHHRSIYDAFLMSGRLNSYLEKIDTQAEDMFDQLVEEMAKAQNVTEQLKADEPMVWIGKMNAIRNVASEVVYHDIIYTPALKVSK
ncbi:MAG: TnpV protein [Lachnospiraceae bacterium]|nr:TnpV protein [Lachnospiraceae bacterium]